MTTPPPDDVMLGLAEKLNSLDLSPAEEELLGEILDMAAAGRDDVSGFAWADATGHLDFVGTVKGAGGSLGGRLAPAMGVYTHGCFACPHPMNPPS